MDSMRRQNSNALKREYDSGGNLTARECRGPLHPDGVMVAVSDYTPSRKGSDGLANLCRPCFAAYQKQRYHANRDGVESDTEMAAGAQVDHLYFIQCMCPDREVKIGRGAPTGRLAAMRTGNPHDLRLIGFIPDAGEQEREWHERFSHLSIRGEWFDWDPSLKAAIYEALDLPTP